MFDCIKELINTKEDPNNYVFIYDRAKSHYCKNVPELKAQVNWMWHPTASPCINLLIYLTF